MSAAPNERVRLGGFFARGRVGTVVDVRRRFGQDRYVVDLDEPYRGRARVVVPWKNVERLEPREFAQGQRVTFANAMLRGVMGTLERPAHLLWKRAWMVRIDGSGLGMRRTRVTERALVPLDDDSPTEC